MKNDNFVGTICNKCRNPTCICKNVKAMKNKNLIGISGKKRSGKNTVASIIQYLIWKSRVEARKSTVLNCTLKDFMNNPLIQISKSGYEQKSFAYKLKQIVSLLTGVPVKDLEKEEVKNSTLPEEWWYWYMELEGGYSPVILDYLTTPKKILKNYDGLKLIKPTYRQVLQQLGTDLLRDQLHPNVHINGLFADYKIKDNLLEGEVRKLREEDLIYPKWILTDPRFFNEIEKIKEYNGIIIRIERNTELRFPELWDDFQNQNKYDSWDDYLKSIDKFDVVYHKSETALDNYTEFDYVIHNNSNLDSLVEKVRKILIKEKIII